MPCTCPYDAWEAPVGAETRRPVFSPRKADPGAKYFKLPCGKCDGCLLDKGGDWSLRAKHEMHFHEASSFLTLTYSDEQLPADYSVAKRPMQLFHMRLRKKYGSRSFRFMCCGEYGDRTYRPHYHSIVFGLDFPDKVLDSRSKGGELLYRSPTLEGVWGFGLVWIGQATPESAGYVARYSLKKVGGEKAPEHYRRLHPLTGEICQVRREFFGSSRRPGIGARYYEKFERDFFSESGEGPSSDFATLAGQKRRVPRFYTDKLAKSDEAAYQAVKAGRVAKAGLHAANNTESRLLVRHEVQKLRTKLLVRPFSGLGDV